MTHTPERLWSRVEFQGKFIQVVTDGFAGENGAVLEREIVRHPGAVAVVAVHEGSVLLVRQMRHAVLDSLLEIPAGKLESGEDPWETGRRELLEETGFGCDNLHLILSCYTTPGFSDERLWIFRADSLRRESDPPTHDGDEPISIEWLPMEEIGQAVREGRIEDAKSIIGLTMLLSEGSPEGGQE